MKIELAILSFLMISAGLCAQPLRFSDKSGAIEIDRTVLMKSRLNGILPIGEIPQPPSPDDLKRAGLGKPIKIERKVVEGIGEEADYVYEGFTLHYSALSQPELLLQGITLHEDSALEFDDGNRLGPGHGLTHLFTESNRTRAKELSGTVHIWATGSTESIKVKLIEGKISETVIRLGLGY